MSDPWYVLETGPRTRHGERTLVSMMRFWVGRDCDGARTHGLPKGDRGPASCEAGVYLQALVVWLLLPIE